VLVRIGVVVVMFVVVVTVKPAHEFMPP
jgi:hypothetical protein